MREIAFIDGIIRGTPSDNRRFETPQLPSGPSFSDLLSRVEESRSTASEYGQINTSPENRSAQEPSVQGKDSYRSNTEAESARERDSRAEKSEDRETAEKRESSEDDAVRSAEERVAEKRNEANQRRAEDEQKQVASRPSETDEGDGEADEAGTALKEAGEKNPAEEAPASEELAKLAVGEGIPKTEKQSESSAKERQEVSPADQDRGVSDKLKIATNKIATKQQGDSAGAAVGKLQELEEQLRGQERGNVTQAKGEEKRQDGAGRSELSGGKALFREFVRLGATQEPVSDEVRQKAEKALSDLESRDRGESGERKLRVVDLRAPRQSRNRGDQGAEQNGEEARSGLKEAAQSGRVEGRESTPLRLEGGESPFARQLDGAQPNRGEGNAQRLVQQQQLHRFLQEKGYGEIVRNARVMLREGGNGELRVNLSPKELGSVRVQLQLQDSHIAGRIIVENSTVREVLEQNLDQLQRAFQAQGLETGRLEVAVEQRGEGRERRNRGDTGRGGGAHTFEEHTARLPDAFYEDAQVNLMA